MAKAEKAVKNKTKDEMLSDILNYHLHKGNIKADRVTKEHKNKIKK